MERKEEANDGTHWNHQTPIRLRYEHMRYQIIYSHRTLTDDFKLEYMRVRARVILVPVFGLEFEFMRNEIKTSFRSGYDAHFHYYFFSIFLFYSA